MWLEPSKRMLALLSELSKPSVASNMKRLDKILRELLGEFISKCESAASRLRFDDSARKPYTRLIENIDACGLPIDDDARWMLASCLMSYDYAEPNPAMPASFLAWITTTIRDHRRSNLKDAPFEVSLMTLFIDKVVSDLRPEQLTPTTYAVAFQAAMLSAKPETSASTVLRHAAAKRERGGDAFFDVIAICIREAIEPNRLSVCQLENIVGVVLDVVGKAVVASLDDDVRIVYSGFDRIIGGVIAPRVIPQYDRADSLDMLAESHVPHILVELVAELLRFVEKVIVVDSNLSPGSSPSPSSGSSSSPNQNQNQNQNLSPGPSPSPSPSPDNDACLLETMVLSLLRWFGRIYAAPGAGRQELLHDEFCLVSCVLRSTSTIFRGLSLVLRHLSPRRQQQQLQRYVELVSPVCVGTLETVVQHMMRRRRSSLSSEDSEEWRSMTSSVTDMVETMRSACAGSDGAQMLTAMIDARVMQRINDASYDETTIAFKKSLLVMGKNARHPELFRWCCNRACTGGSSSSPAAADGAVGLKTCKGCRAVRYCSVACQKEDWKAGHVDSCKRDHRRS